MEMDNQEIEIVDLQPTISKIKDAFSTSSESFARRLKDSLINLDNRFTENIKEYERVREEQGLTVSNEFTEYSHKLQEILEESKKGKDIDERQNIVAELQKDQLVLDNLAKNENSDLNLNELDVLNDVITVLIREINPRNLSTRVLQGSKEAIIGLAEGLGSELKGAVGDLQGHIEDLAEEFPPLRIGLEKTNEFLNFIIGNLFSTVSGAFAKRKEAREEAAALANDSIIEKTTTPEKVVKQKASKEQSINKPSNKKSNMIELGDSSIKRLSKALAKELGKSTNKTTAEVSPVQTALLTAGTLKLLNRSNKSKDKNANKPSLFSRLLPFLAVGTVALTSLLTLGVSSFGLIIGFLTTVVTALTSGALFKHISKLGPKIIGALKSLGSIIKGALSALAGKIIGGLKNFLPKAGKALRGAATAAASRASKIAKVGGTVLKTGAKLATKALVPLTVAGAVGSGAIRAFKKNQEGGTFSENVKEFGKGALSFTTAGLSDKVLDDDKKEVKAGEPEMVSGLITDKTIKISNIDKVDTIKTIEEALPSLRLREQNIQLQNAIGTNKVEQNNRNITNSKMMINNNNVSKSTYINKVSPENHESSYIEKSKAGFAN